jgi:hypothetical protein
MFKLVALALTGTLMAGSSMGATIYSQDFESNSAGFAGSAGGLASSQVLGAAFGNQVFNNEDVPSAVSTLSLNLGQAANGATMTLSLAIIDSWDNGTNGFGPDEFSVKLDGATLFSAVFDNFLNQGATIAPGLTSTSYGSNLAGNGIFNDATYGLSVGLGNLSAGAHTIEFVASGPFWQGLNGFGGSDESYSIDNIEITAAVPEPSTGALMALGLAGVGVIGKRRSGR